MECRSKDKFIKKWIKKMEEKKMNEKYWVNRKKFGERIKTDAGKNKENFKNEKQKKKKRRMTMQEYNQK